MLSFFPHWHGILYCLLPSPGYAAVIRPGLVYLPAGLCHHVIRVVLIPNSFCGVSSTSTHFLSLNLTTYKARSLGRLWTGRGLKYHLAVCVSIWWVTLYFCVFIEHHYSCDGFFGETVGEKYLLHLLSVYGVKCLGEIYK